VHSDFITDINNAIDTLLDAGKYRRGNILGLAELVANGEEGTIPMIVSDAGEGTSVVIDDNYTIQIYHRHTGSTYADIPDQSFGSGANEVRETASIRMIVIADRERLEESKSDLINYVVMGFPQRFSDTDTSAYDYVSQVNVTVNSTNLDSSSVYADEYGIESDLPPQYVMASIDYELAIDINKKCFDSCT
jgi:hypothetical protein